MIVWNEARSSKNSFSSAPCTNHCMLEFILENQLRWENQLHEEFNLYIYNLKQEGLYETAQITCASFEALLGRAHTGSSFFDACIIHALFIGAPFLSALFFSHRASWSPVKKKIWLHRLCDTSTAGLYPFSLAFSSTACAGGQWKWDHNTGGCFWTACENPFPQAAHLVNRMCKWSIYIGGSLEMDLHRRFKNNRL
jgi:hypothetical protein